MSLLDRIAAWSTRNLPRAERAATKAIAFEPPGAAVYGPGATNQTDHETLLRESVGVPDFATRAIADRVSSLELEVKVERQDETGTTVDEVLDDHPLARLLQRPHPNLSMRQLLRLTAQWIITVGEAYWLKVGSGFGVPVELHPMPPGRITPLVETGIVRAYNVMDGRGQITAIPANTVVRMYFPDPENPWRSEGYLGPSGISADASKFAGQHLRRHYQFDATPKLALEAQEGAQDFSPSSWEAFTQSWSERYGSRYGSRPSSPAKIPTFWKLIQLEMQTGKDIAPLLEYWRDDLLMAYGVPRSVRGQVVSGDRSSAETNQWAFDMYAVSPVAGLIADGLTAQLAPDFDAVLKVEFCAYIAPDKEFELKREAQDLEHAVTTINGVLEARGGDTVKWGEKPIIASTLKPYDPNEKPQPLGRPPAPGEPVEEEPEDDERAERDLHAKVRQAFRKRRKAA